MWQMSCPRCGTWKEWTRHDICSSCGAKTDVVELPEGEREVPILQARQGKPVEDFSKAVVVAEAPVVPPQAGVLRSDNQRRYERRVNEWVKVCEEYGVDRLDAKLIASALIPTSSTPIWLIVESSNAPFWADFSFCMEKLG